MAIVLPSRNDTFDVILSMDSALDVTEEEFDLYRQTGDESHLKFKEGMQPTRFVMRSVIPNALAKKVLNEQMTYKDGKAQIQTSFMVEEVRASLVDIKNPADLPEESHIKFEKEKDGGASEKLMELLVAAGVHTELYTARALRSAKLTENLKKK